MNTIEGEGGESKQDQSYYDPRIFLSDFEKSPEYQAALDLRLKELNLPDPDQEKRDLIHLHFQGKEGYKEALWQFVIKHPLHFKPEIYSPESLEKLNEYWQFIGDNKKEIRKSGRDFDEADALRMNLHTKAAEQLITEGWISNFTTARQIVHFLSIDRGVDTVDFDRDERRLAAEASRIIDEEEKAA